MWNFVTNDCKLYGKYVEGLKHPELDSVKGKIRVHYYDFDCPGTITTSQTV